MEDASHSDSPAVSRELFSELMRTHHRDLLVFASAATGSRDAAQDIVQESFVSAWRSFHQFDLDRDFGAWMRGITRNKTKDWFRKQQRDPSKNLDWEELETTIASWNGARDAGIEVYEVVENCIAQLPTQFERAVRTFYFADLSGNDAAASLEISAANLRKRLQRARALLHECITLKTQPQTDQAHV